MINEGSPAFHVQYKNPCLVLDAVVEGPLEQLQACLASDEYGALLFVHKKENSKHTALFLSVKHQQLPKLHALLIKMRAHGLELTGQLEAALAKSVKLEDASYFAELLRHLPSDAPLKNQQSLLELIFRLQKWEHLKAYLATHPDPKVLAKAVRWDKVTYAAFQWLRFSLPVNPNQSALYAAAQAVRVGNCQLLEDLLSQQELRIDDEVPKAVRCYESTLIGRIVSQGTKQICVGKNWSELLALALRFGANVNLCFLDKQSLLHQLLANKKWKEALLLLQHQKPEIPDLPCCLQLIVRNHQFALLKQCLSYSPNPDWIRAAIVWDSISFESLALILAHLTEENAIGKTELCSEIIDYHRPDLLERLLKEGTLSVEENYASPADKGKRSHTILARIIRVPFFDIRKQLPLLTVAFRYGADPSIFIEEGVSALSYAVLKRQKELATCLLNKGAAIHSEEKGVLWSQKMPLHLIAKKLGWKDVADLMEKQRIGSTGISGV